MPSPGNHAILYFGITAQGTRLTARNLTLVSGPCLKAEQIRLTLLERLNRGCHSLCTVWRSTSSSNVELHITGFMLSR